MTKTEHYQLPQWEATDPMKREDFNQSNAAIDAAIKAAENKADKAQTAHEAGDTQLWNGLLQMGERYLKERYDAMDETALTQEDNLLLNPLTSAEMAETLDGAEWDAEQKVHIGRGPELSRTYLRSYCTSYTYATVNTMYKDVTSTYEFTSPVNGRVLDFDLRYYFFFSSTNTAFTGGSLTFKAYEKQNGSYVNIYTKSGITFEKSGTATAKGATVIKVEVPLKKGCEYRFTLHIDSGSGVLGYLGLIGNAETDDSQFTVSIDPVTSGKHTKSLYPRGVTTHAIVLMRYQQEESFGGVTAVMDGVPLDEFSRSETTVDGATEYELVLRGMGTYSEEPTLEVSLQCSETDRLSLIKYGVFLM